MSNEPEKQYSSSDGGGCGCLIAIIIIIWAFVSIHNMQKDLNYYKDLSDSLQQENSNLQDENEELKQKLDDIEDMSSERDYNYSDILNDIEDEASY